jgi:2-polyprenyl-3-methyl-5-hydroxy-6-metoxy-1,4-benzoquinol methylase
MHYTDWYFNSSEPSSYKHEINLYNWLYDPAQCEFAEGGVFGRMIIKPDDKVLDLCCGDGSYSYLFFSDVAQLVDAIDYDQNSIEYAIKTYNKNNIHFMCENLLTNNLKKNFYDVIVWRSGVAYFTKEQRKHLYGKIFESLKNDGKIYIGTPLMVKENFTANQVEVITNEENFEHEFDNIFDIFFKQKTFYKNNTNLHYILKKHA